MAHRESLVAQLALQSSSAARLQRQTHLTTLNMASVEEETAGTALSPSAAAAAAASTLPLSQLSFKALLRASLAAARLHHGYVTTPHLLLGLVSAGSTSLAAPATVDSSSDRLAAAAEAAVVALIDGPGSMGRGGTQAVVAGAGAAASLLGRSCGLDVVQWVPALSGPAREVLLAAEGLRQAQGECGFVALGAQQGGVGASQQSSLAEGRAGHLLLDQGWE